MAWPPARFDPAHAIAGERWQATGPEIAPESRCCDNGEVNGSTAHATAGQPRHFSLLESLLNMAVGYGIAVAAQVLIFPMFAIHVPLRGNLEIGACFTVISLAWSFVLRRLFNAWHVRRARTLG